MVTKLCKLSKLGLVIASMISKTSVTKLWLDQDAVIGCLDIHSHYFRIFGFSA